jgi:hypothetical protein
MELERISHSARYRVIISDLNRHPENLWVIFSDPDRCIKCQVNYFSRIFEQQEPFVKTATHKIKRYLYAHPHKKE